MKDVKQLLTIVIDYQNGEKKVFELPANVAKMIYNLVTHCDELSTYYFQQKNIDDLLAAKDFLNSEYINRSFTVCIDKYHNVVYKIPYGDKEEDYDIVPVNRWDNVLKKHTNKLLLIPRRHKLNEIIANRKLKKNSTK